MKNIFNLFVLLNIEILIKANKLDEAFNLNQNDYQVKYERAELVRYNKDYLRDMSVVTYKYNRITPVSNITLTFKFDIGNDLEVKVILQAYTFMSNEYREFPMRFGANFCKGLAANTFGSAAITKCGNFTGCPFVKGRKVHMCNWSTDQSKFPPFIPSGAYKFEAQGMYLSVKLYVVNFYGAISRPFGWH